MEKVKIGIEMSTRWTDPPMFLTFLVPYGLICIWWTLSSLLSFSLMGLVNAALPWGFTWLWWNVAYHRCEFLLENKDLDTSKFVTFKDPKLAAYWKHRRIPVCELYEFYISMECDWNQECEGGDCYLILENHRQEFLRWQTTWRQVQWLIVQFFPQWMTGAGLGKGSSSGKSIEETTKEIDEHYNKGNDVFGCIMGKSMVYTCGVFHEIPQFASSGHKGNYAASAADGTLETAQANKMSMICEKLMLDKKETFLDIGCGWGTLARHAKGEFKCKESTGVTLSSEGKKYCDAASEKTGIPTTIICKDYREIPKDLKFDKIASIEMAEHVGIANFVSPYLTSVRKLMAKKDSKFLMQVAGLRQGANWEDVQWGLFMSKYIFPGADASTPLNWYIKQCEKAGFEVHSVETIGRHYSHTLHKWYDNWMSHKEDILSGKIDAISEHSKGEHLFRLNEFFLAWSTIASGQGTATCYQILMHPNEPTYPRDQWVDPKYVSSPGLVGVGLSNAKGQPKETKSD